MSLITRVKDAAKANPKLATIAALAAAYWLYKKATTRKNDVRGKVVLITGGGSGLGRLMAIKFALLGSRVVLWDINTKGLDAVAQEIHSELNKAGSKSASSASGGAGVGVGGDSKSAVVYTYVCDVSNSQSVSTMAERVKAEVGDVDILINNAGVVSGRFVEEISDDAIKRTFGVNTLALFWTIRAFLPGMIAKRAGHICNIASAAGLVGISKMTDYAASKHAAVGMTESLRNELKHRGLNRIKTTLVCPYYINTGMFAGVPSSIILPILDEKYVVSQIVHAIRTENELLVMPGLVNLLSPLRMLPVALFDWIGNVLKLNTTMDHFAGRTIDPVVKPTSAAAGGSATVAAAAAAANSK